jgi:ABC-type nitrate/sulfonate/bicarbonate transport system permease component
MQNLKRKNKVTEALWIVAGSALFLVIWMLLKTVFNVPDRILPSIRDTFAAIADFEPNIGYHILSTVSRLLIGFSGGVLFGTTLGIFMYSSGIVNKLILPTVQSFRAVPPIATVPFFILWFGFSELGRYIIVVSGIGFNIAISTFQILQYVPEKYQVLFRSFGRRPSKMLVSYMIPRILEDLLPTIRFSLSMALGLVIVSELLGAQLGLGYLIQTSRSTYSMHVIFLCMILLGLINFLFDKIITLLWQKLIFWKN